MKVLMFGWEFPPKVSGGLGVACHGIVQGLLAKHVDITLVLPFLHNSMPLTETRLTYQNALSCQEDSGHIDIELVDALLKPYLSAEQYLSHRKSTTALLYGNDLWSEVHRYANQAIKIAEHTPHDVIHAHDWLTILAGLAAKKVSGKPLIFHIHALEQDRSPNGANPATCAIEYQGLQEADAIIAVSQYTKSRIIELYGIADSKIEVIYNGHLGSVKKPSTVPKFNADRYTVLFLGRVTEQKGPYYFIKTAEKILSIRQDIEFIIAGEGDQLASMIELSAQLGISSHVHFTGFLDRNEVSKFYQLSDVYVMPSVSEPFGIVCLEAIAYGIPVVISKQSGVSEVLTHSLKVDYWDIDQFAANIMALLDYPALQKEMLAHAKRQLAELTWDATAQEILHLYHQWV